jgi:hypothetical protein
MIKTFARKLAFYPTSLLLRHDIARTRSALQGSYRYLVFDRLGISGFGDHVLRIDFPPPRPSSDDLGIATKALEAIFGKFEQQIRDHFSDAAQCAVEFGLLPERQPEDATDPTPWRDNEFYSGADALALMSILKRYSPKRYIEIGSGMSTRIANFMRLSGRGRHQIVSFDPEPRITVAQVADKIVRSPLDSQSCLTILDMAQPGDVIFFDGSHRSLPGSDVNVFFLELLPNLPPGCIIHIHDIYLPFEYPSGMINRYWSEQYMLAAFLIGGGWRKLEPILPVYYCCRSEEYNSPLKPTNMTAGSGFWAITR